ncbi:MAG TPA: hypothetical protein VIR30_02710 [Nocardioides sp.]
MKYCPLCRVALQPDTIGGNATPRGKIPPKAVLLCTSCWTVYPEQQRHLAPVPEAGRNAQPRRGLA